jgi:peptidoglycan L-alanyl-D-glutamate endopeptidase CwlK
MADSRSEKNIATLLPDARPQAREFLKQTRAAGINAKIIGGTRTFAEQDALFALGRTKPGKIVTNARGGFSNHNFGVAWDIGIFKGTQFLGDSPQYDEAGQIGKTLGLEWGGDFNSIIDKPHFQCRTGKTLAQLRALAKANKPIPVLPLTPLSPLQVRLDGEKLTMPGFLIANRPWIAAQELLDLLEGSLSSVGGDPLNVTVSHGGSERQLTAQTIATAVYVKFADLNGLLDLEFVLDSAKQRLDLKR